MRPYQQRNLSGTYCLVRTATMTMWFMFAKKRTRFNFASLCHCFIVKLRDSERNFYLFLRTASHCDVRPCQHANQPPNCTYTENIWFFSAFTFPFCVAQFALFSSLHDFFCRKKYHLFEEKFTTFGETVVIWCQRDFNQIKRYSVHLSVCLFCEYLFLRCINLSSICFFARLQIYFLLPLSWLNYSTVDSYLLIPIEPLSLNLNKSSLMFICN